jgi:hypothetical protein
MESFLKQIKAKASLPTSEREYASACLLEIYRRFPKCGTELKEYAYANILHPYFRGNLVRVYPHWREVFDSFILENESEVEEVWEDIDSAAVLDEGQEQDEFWASADLVSQNLQKAVSSTREVASGGPSTPLKTEFDIYVNLPKPPNSKIDILDWWRGQKVIFLIFKI